MVIEHFPLFVAQWSSTLTLVFGIITLFFAIQAVQKLLPGEFREITWTSVFFLIIINVGILSMLIYHFTEDTSYANLNYWTENIWSVFMFITLLFACLESWKYAKFGKFLSSIKIQRVKKSQKKRKK